MVIYVDVMQSMIEIFKYYGDNVIRVSRSWLGKKRNNIFDEISRHFILIKTTFLFFSFFFFYGSRENFSGRLYTSYIIISRNIIYYILYTEGDDISVYVKKLADVPNDKICLYENIHPKKKKEKKNK